MLDWKHLRGKVDVSTWGTFDDLSWLGDAVKKEFEKTISEILPDFKVSLFLDKEKNNEIMVELTTPLGAFEFEGPDFFVSLRELVMDEIEFFDNFGDDPDTIPKLEKYRDNLQSITDEVTNVIKAIKEKNQ
tara:strand:- start:327 stop:719 length:393 start_codon:yes stop_codon:yes gene_type:complete